MSIRKTTRSQDRGTAPSNLNTYRAKPKLTPILSVIQSTDFSSVSSEPSFNESSTSSSNNFSNNDDPDISLSNSNENNNGKFLFKEINF